MGNLYLLFKKNRFRVRGLSVWGNLYRFLKKFHFELEVYQSGGTWLLLRARAKFGVRGWLSRLDLGRREKFSEISNKASRFAVSRG